MINYTVSYHTIQYPMLCYTIPCHIILYYTLLHYIIFCNGGDGSPTSPGNHEDGIILPQRLTRALGCTWTRLTSHIAAGEDRDAKSRHRLRMRVCDDFQHLETHTATDIYSDFRKSQTHESSSMEHGPDCKST